MEEQDVQMQQAAAAADSEIAEEGFWDVDMLTNEIRGFNDVALTERWKQQSLEYMTRMCITLNSRNIDETGEAVTFVRAQLFPQEQPNFRAAREMDPSTSELREQSILARAIYLAELDESYLHDEWSIADMGKMFSVGVALSNDAGQVQRRFTRAVHIEHLDALRKACPDPDIVRVSLQKLLDIRVHYYSGSFLHPLLSTKGFAIDWQKDVVSTPSGAKFKFHRDPVGLGFGWLEDEAGFANELSSIAATTVRIVPHNTVAEHAVMHLMSKFVFVRDGNRYVANVRAAPDTDANFFSKFPSFGQKLRKRVHKWLPKVEIPGNLSSSEWIATYLHFAVNWAMENDKKKMRWPKPSQVSQYLRKNIPAALSARLEWLKGVKSAEQLAAALPSGPASNLLKVMTDLDERRKRHSHPRYNNVFHTADVDMGGAQHHEAANRQIYSYLVDRLKSTHGRRYDCIYVYLEGSSPIHDICRDLYPNAAIEVYSTTGAKGTAKWDPQKGYSGVPATVRALVIDDSGSAGDIGVTNRAKTVNLSRVGENRVDYLVRWTMVDTCPLARHKKGDELEYDLPYDLSSTMKLFYHTELFAGGKAHSPEYWTSLLGRKTVPFDEKDSMTGTLSGAVSDPAKAFTSLVMKTVLMSIANSWRRVIWSFGVLAAFGPRAYIDEGLWNLIAAHTGFGRIPRLQYMELKSFLAMKEVVAGQFADDGSPVDLLGDGGQFAGKDLTLNPQVSARLKAVRSRKASAVEEEEEEEADVAMRDAPEKRRGDN